MKVGEVFVKATMTSRIGRTCHLENWPVKSPQTPVSLFLTINTSITVVILAKWK